MRYEVLHVPSVLQRVSQRGSDAPTYNAPVATGNGVSSFAWIGENDVFAVIHSPDADKLGQASSVDAPTPVLGEVKGDFASLSAQKIKDLADIRSLNVKNLAVNTGKSAGKVVTSTAKIGKTAAGATVNVVGTAAGKTAGVVHKTTKVFSLNRFRKGKKGSDTDTVTEEDEDKAPPPPPMMQPGVLRAPV